MESPSSSSNKYSIVSDYKLSLRLLFQNFIPIFIVLAIGVVISELLDYYFLEILFPGLPYYEYNFPPTFLYLLCNLPGDAIYYGFFGVCMGLCYDVMSSGDQFTQVKRFPLYLGKYWLKFFFLSLIINFPLYLTYLIEESWTNPMVFVSLWALTHFIFYLMVGINPGILLGKNLWNAMKDDIFLLKTQFLRIIITFGIITLVFSSPLVILKVMILNNPGNFAEVTRLENLYRIFNYIKIAIGNPLLAFLSIGIYNENIVFPNHSKNNK